MKQLKESNARTETAETTKSNDRSIVKSIRNTMIIGLPLTTVLSGVLAIGFAIALDGCSSKEKDNKTAQILRSPSRPWQFRNRRRKPAQLRSLWRRRSRS